MLNPSYNYMEFIAELFPEYNDKGMKNLTFQVTDDCNLCCSYCYQQNKHHHIMTFDVAKKFIDYIFDNRTNEDSPFTDKKVKGYILEFIGGEPLLAIDLIDQISTYFEHKVEELPKDHLWKYFHMYNICSNGVLYFTPKVQKYIKKFDTLISFNVTLDGCKELHDKCRLFPDGSGSYDLAMAAALDLQKRGFKNTKITFSPDNINYVFKGITNIIELGFTDIYANCVFEDVWHDQNKIKEYYKELKKVADWLKEKNLNDKIFFRIFASGNYLPLKEEELDRQWCGTTSCMYALDYKGDIYSCLRFMESSLGNDVPPLILGNVNRGIATLPQEKKVLKDFENYTKRNISEEKCLKCPIESGCAWCAGCSYQLCGDLCHRTTTICECHKAEYLATLYYYKIIDDKKHYDFISKVDYDFVKDIIDLDEYNYLLKEE